MSVHNQEKTLCCNWLTALLVIGLSHHKTGCMDLLNKLKGTVSNALPGNPASREFDITNHIASGGPGLLWKIYDGIKKTTKQDVSVFVLDKRLLEKYPKCDREPIVQVLKKGVSQLTRLRHPKILSILHPLEESRDSLTFATEPVSGSLANYLGYHDNLPSPIPSNIKDHELYDVEIKYGLLQVTEGLTFLHNDVKMVHRNVCPESIMINKSGSWKLAAFDFCISNQSSAEQSATYPYHEWDPERPPVAQPLLDYLAPEYALTHTCDTSSDMYSLSILMFAIFNKGRPLFECHNQWGTFQRNAQVLRTLSLATLNKIPEELREYVKLLLNVEPTLRPDAHQVTKIAFFEDVGAMTLQYLDSIFQEDNLRKSKFFKGLVQIIIKMPKRVNLQRVLPILFKECVNPDMVPFVLPDILQIGEQSSNEEYNKHIFPGLIPLFKLKEPFQILVIFLQNMGLIMSKTQKKDITNHVLPMMFAALESETPQIQDLALNIVPTIANLIDFSTMKNAVIPRIKKLCLSTTSLGVRVNCLVCIGKLLEFMDKWFVLDEIFPIMPLISSRQPGVMMSILGIYKVAFSHAKLGITKEILATKVLPFLIPLSIDSSLNLDQYVAFSTVIREMVSRVESEHKTKLEQLNSIQKEQKTIHFEAVQDSGALVQGVTQQKDDTMMDKFLSTFGMSKSSATSTPATESKSPSAKPIAHTIQKPKPTLTLEEKQRIARDQEQQRRLKSQTPLTKMASQSVSTPSQSVSRPANTKTQPKDLTSTLMSSNLSNIGPSSVANSGVNWVSATGSIPNSKHTAKNWVGATGGSHHTTGVNWQGANTQHVANPGITWTGSTNNTSNMQTNNQTGMLAFNTSPTMNQTKQTGYQPQGMMGNIGMMGNNQNMTMGSGYMGNNPMGQSRTQMPMPTSTTVMPGGTGSNIGMMGSNTGMMGSNSSMLGNNSAMLSSNSNAGIMGDIMMPQQNTFLQKQSKLSQNDIDDLLG